MAAGDHGQGFGGTWDFDDDDYFGYNLGATEQGNLGASLAL